MYLFAFALEWRRSKAADGPRRQGFARGCCRFVASRVAAKRQQTLGAGSWNGDESAPEWEGRQVFLSLLAATGGKLERRQQSAAQVLFEQLDYGLPALPGGVLPGIQARPAQVFRFGQ